MIKPEQIPDEVVEAAVLTWVSAEGTIADGMRAALAAGLAAWKGMLHQRGNETTIVCRSALILPLSEVTNDR